VSAASILNGIGVIGGLGGLAALAKVLIDRTKIRTDAVDQIADTSVRMLAPLHGEIDRLSLKLKAAESQIDDLEARMKTMATQRDQADILRGQLAVVEQGAETLRAQIRSLYDEMAGKDRLIIEKDRIIAALRLSHPST
jgi:predicted  nucleic acid-binding Zn-ribbon protein